MALGNRNPQLDLGLRCSPMADGRMAHGRCTHQYRTYSSMLFRYFKQRLLTYLGTLNWRGLSNWAGSPGLRKHSCGFRIRYFWFEPRESRNSPGSLIMRIVLLKAKSQKEYGHLDVLLFLFWWYLHLTHRLFNILNGVFLHFIIRK
jgi:hypothetical protein